MDNLLNNKCILVFGACGLLGRKIVDEILLQNGRVIAVDICEDKLTEIFSNYIDGDFKERLFTVVADILNSKDIVDNIESSVFEIDGVVNATYPKNKNYGKHFFEVSRDSFNENCSMHLGSSFLIMQCCARYFQKHRKPFSLVNVGSIYGSVTPDFSIYEGTNMTVPVEYPVIKSALLSLSKYVVSYVQNSDFRINCVSPGGLYDGQPESFLSLYKGKTLGKGMLDAKDVAISICFFLSDMSRYVNGQNLLVDDGFSI